METLTDSLKGQHGESGAVGTIQQLYMFRDEIRCCSCHPDVFLFSFSLSEPRKPWHARQRYMPYVCVCLCQCVGVCMLCFVCVCVCVCVCVFVHKYIGEPHSVSVNGLGLPCVCVCVRV